MKTKTTKTTKPVRMIAKTLPTKYGSFESAQIVASLFEKAGLDALVVMGTRYFRVRIYVEGQ